MPKLRSSVPAYRKHKPSGRAVVTLSGQDFYLGPYGSQVSKDAYDRAIAEWLARGRRPVAADAGSDVGQMTVVELLTAYHSRCKTHYRSNPYEVDEFVRAGNPVQKLYGRLPVGEFGPLKLQAVQQDMMARGWSCDTINRRIRRIVRCFRWGVSRELVPTSVAEALAMVEPLEKGRTGAKDREPVRPVAESAIQATLPHLPQVVSDMVRLQRLTGCRPQEVCSLRPCDVDASGPVWAYRPAHHKTKHHGKERVIFIGPKGQEILRPYLLREKDAFCFCPAEAEEHRRRERHAQRVTPLDVGNVPGSNRVAKPRRQPGQRYTTASYRRAIQRACQSAFAMPAELRKAPARETPEQKRERLAAAAAWRAAHVWAPNQLRHTAATELRKRYGLEAASVTLGHSKMDVTQIYAEKNLELAARVAAEVG